jgi:hypothetical protein
MHPRSKTNTENPTERKSFSMAEIAERNSLSKNFIRGQILGGHLKAKRLGRRLVVMAVDEESWLSAAPAAKAVK